MNLVRHLPSLLLVPCLTIAATHPKIQNPWDVLDKSLTDGNVDHRREALAAVATLSGTNPEAVKRAENALQDADPRVRLTAALALGQMKAMTSVPYLKRALEDTDEVAFAAAKALIDIQGDDPDARDVMVAVLAGERKDTPGFMTTAVRKAQDELHHPAGLMLMGAQDATGAMFGPAAMGFTAAKDALDLRQDGAPGRAAAAAYLAKDPNRYAVSLLEWALNDNNQFVRAEAAKGLGERGTEDSVPKLEPLLKDPHTRVRTIAAAAIIRLSTEAPGRLTTQNQH
jgi:HEAT repeat protein